MDKEPCKLDASALCSKGALQNADINSTQLMPQRVNTTHTMGVDVIDWTVESGGVGDSTDTEIIGLDSSRSLEDI